MEEGGSDAKHKNHQMHGLMFPPVSNYALKSCMLSKSHSGPIEDITKPMRLKQLVLLRFAKLSSQDYLVHIEKVHV